MTLRTALAALSLALLAGGCTEDVILGGDPAPPVCEGGIACIVDAGPPPPPNPCHGLHCGELCSPMCDPSTDGGCPPPPMLMACDMMGHCSPTNMVACMGPCMMLPMCAPCMFCPPGDPMCTEPPMPKMCAPSGLCAPAGMGCP